MTEHHALVAALVADIPTGNLWPESNRERWLTAAAAVFDLVYGVGDMIDMREVLVRATATDAVSSKQLLTVEPVAGAIEPGTTITYESEPERKDVILESTVAPARDVGGRPKTSGPVRPAGIPTNLAMALEAIDDNYDKATPAEILKFVRTKYWAEAPSSWTASLYDQVTAKKLTRDGINFIRPVEPKVESKPVAPIAAAPPARPVSAPENRAPANGVEFSYGGKRIFLHKNEARLAEALRNAMGKGHLDYTFLARMGLASDRRPSNNDKNWCAEMMLILQPKLESIGLRVKHAPAFGYVMERADS